MGPVRIRHSSHDFATQPSHSVDRAGGKPKWLPLNIGYHDVTHRSPILIYHKPETEKKYDKVLNDGLKCYQSEVSLHKVHFVFVTG